MHNPPKFGWKHPIFSSPVVRVFYPTVDDPGRWHKCSDKHQDKYYNDSKVGCRWFSRFPTEPADTVILNIHQTDFIFRTKRKTRPATDTKPHPDRSRPVPASSHHLVLSLIFTFRLSIENLEVCPTWILWQFPILMQRSQKQDYLHFEYVLLSLGAIDYH